MKNITIHPASNGWIVYHDGPVEVKRAVYVCTNLKDLLHLVEILGRQHRLSSPTQDPHDH